jgi:ApbE superfamily uncharacterized protein (UPF0280 family)
MVFREFSHKKALYKIGSPSFDRACQFLIELREELEEYLGRNRDFLGSLVPVTPVFPAPEIARRMMEASQITGLGPMASVAGTMAQMACERLNAAGLVGNIIENGGDIYMNGKEDVTLGIYAGETLFKGKLAFHIKAVSMPLSVCSSSGTMGHSLSLGCCDLATVIAKNASLADSAATLAGNMVKTRADLKPAVNHILSLPGIEGVFLVKGEEVGLGGNLPELVSLKDPDITAKITHDKSDKSSFPR